MSRIFIPPPDSSLLYAGHYDLVLVGLSLAVAIFAAYAALLVARQATHASAPGARRTWIVMGGLCLGLGIWAMHFVGMLAFNLPCTTGYDISLTLLSMLPAMAACTLVMHLISRQHLTRTQLVFGGALLGAGIGLMHYTGMAALRLDGLVRYNPWLFALSILVAVALALLAIWSKFRLQRLPQRRARWALPTCAVIIGLAVSTMHYTAMAAAYFLREGDGGAVDTQIGPVFLASMVLIATTIITLMTLVASQLARPNLLTLTHSHRLMATLVVGWAVLVWFGLDRYYGQFIADLYQTERRDTAEQMDGLVRNLDETLRGIKGIPQLFSADPSIRQALRQFHQTRPSPLPYAQRKRQWSTQPTLLALDQSLHATAKHLPIDAIWVMNAAGDCIAASNFNHPDSFVGSNFGSRTYFQQARNGQIGQQYAVGQVSKIPGLFYSYPVMEQDRFLGVVVVKRNVSGFAGWFQHANAFASDANGVIVLSADTSLLLRALPEAHVMKLTEQQLRAQYTQTTLRPLRIEPWGDARLPEAVRINQSSRPALFLSRALPDGMLTVHVAHELGEVARLQTQKTWLFALLSSTGSMLIVMAFAVVQYVRELRQSGDALRIAATAFQSQEGMVITDAAGVILRVNHAFTQMTGYTAEEAVGQTPRLLKSGLQDDSFYTAMWDSVTRTGTWQGEVWNRNKNGTIYPSWLTVTAVRDVDGQTTHYVGMQTDITQRKASEEKIAHLAFYDPLTELPNRRLLLDRLQQALATSLRNERRGALLFIDLDNFKTLNDTLGHDKGDLLLKEVAQRLTVSLREGDTVARLGGDEFVIMLEDLHAQPEEAADEAKVVAEKIIATLQRPYQLGSYKHHSTCSVGIALFGSQQDTTEELLKRADLAMYQAKAAGRNTLRFFDPDMQAAVNARAQLEAELREALRTQQLVLYYQLQAGGAGHPIGAEVLVRWQHPRHGLIAPAEFIALAEDTGLIVPLGLWVLEATCVQLAAWARDPAKAHLTLAVNVSARQFHHPDFVDQVLATLEHTGADPRRLKLELTESLLVDDVEDTIGKMEVLKNHGIGFALDDFGTGYSSLAYLKRLPLDQLKIDKSFVRDVFTDSNDATIVKTIVALAGNLGLNVIAEGVETEPQRDFLANNGCLAYQGYLYGKPVPLAELEAELKVSTTGA